MKQDFNENENPLLSQGDIVSVRARILMMSLNLTIY